MDVAATLLSGFAGSTLALVGAWALQWNASRENRNATREQIIALMRAIEARMRTTAGEPRLDLAKDVWTLWDRLFEIAFSPEGARACAGRKNIFDDLVNVARGRLVIEAQRATRDYYRRGGSAEAFQEQYENLLRANSEIMANIMKRCRAVLDDHSDVAAESAAVGLMQSEIADIGYGASPDAPR